MRPKLLIGLWLFFVWPVPALVNMLFATSLPLNAMWLLSGMVTGLDAIRIGAVYWMLMLRPYSKLAWLIPAGVLILPSLVTLAWMQLGSAELLTVRFPGGGQTNMRDLQIAGVCNHLMEITTAGCLIYLFSLGSGIQLRRGEQQPQPLEMRLSSLFLVTSIMAAAFALSQFIPAGANPWGEVASEYFGIVNGLQYGLTWVLIGWAVWKDTKSSLRLAFVISISLITVVRSVNVWWLSDRFPGADKLDAATFATIVFCGFSACFATLMALLTIQFCGYFLTASTSSQSQTESFDDPGNP